MGSATAGPGWTTARVVTLAGAAAYAGALAVTTPFTLPADVLTAIGLAVGAAALAHRLRVDRLVTRRPASAAPTAARAGTEGSLLPWAALLVAVVGWELYCFLGGPRAAHPTLSSLYDIATRWDAAKALVVLAWVALGWVLVRR